MANPATREQLKDYALRSLGAPVIEINVAEEQLEDRLDEAIEYFQDEFFRFFPIQQPQFLIFPSIF